MLLIWTQFSVQDTLKKVLSVDIKYIQDVQGSGKYFTVNLENPGQAS